MRKFLSFTILSFIIFTSPTKAGSYGEGDLQLAKHTVEAFIKHIRSKGNNKPADFYVTLDGQYSVRWFCGHGDFEVAKRNAQPSAIHRCARKHRVVGRPKVGAPATL